ncbi:MAG: HemK/PrmC family methyltransferase [Gordonibacter sp.]|uniref:N5-glutamine methyltransferase family protein n=1 Tax=Gordonibacter sp. TaxID=1968902 RepID=UPI002FCA07B3
MAENDIWTIKAALDWTVGYLERKGDESPRISAQWLLGEACGMRRIDLYTHFDQPLTLEERDVLRGYVTRRGAGEPLQYITGEVAFRHITVKVRSGVLIPRPETEVLVSEGLSCLPPAPRPRAADDGEAGVDAASSPVSEVPAEGAILGPEDSLHARALSSAESASPSIGAADQVSPRSGGAGGGEQALLQGGGTAESDRAVQLAGPLVADLCTGSGCIACSIAYEHPLARVVATDIAPEAVALAGENASALGLEGRVQVVACDLGEGIDAELMGCFDLVVSNPPYVPTAVLDDIPREVAAFEPALALDGGDDGLDVFRRLLPFCARALKPGGAFAFELHETCLDEAARLAQVAGFTGVRVVDDLAGRPRVLVARRTL